MNKTFIECNIYARTPRHIKATQHEFAMTKKEVEVEIERLALQQEELLKGNSQFHHREDIIFPKFSCNLTADDWNSQAGRAERDSSATQRC
jgi:hypothetical protein